MVSYVEITPEQQADIRRRYWLGKRAGAWLDQHGQNPIAQTLGISQSQVNKALTSGARPKKLNDAQWHYLLSKGRRSARVHKIQQRHSCRQLMREYGISAMRVKRYAGDLDGNDRPNLDEPRRTTCVDVFLTKTPPPAYPTAPQATGYY